MLCYVWLSSPGNSCEHLGIRLPFFLLPRLQPAFYILQTLDDARIPGNRLKRLSEILLGSLVVLQQGLAQSTAVQSLSLLCWCQVSETKDSGAKADGERTRGWIALDGGKSGVCQQWNATAMSYYSSRDAFA